MSTQYSALLEQLRMLQVNGKWQVAMRLTREPKNAIVFECKDSEFPQSTDWPVRLNSCYPWHF